MLPLATDRDDLALALRGKFKRLAGHLECASDVNKVFTEIMAGALRVLSDELCSWNLKRRRLPTEVLAACFAFLPLEARVTASHVSRAWRAAALTFPELWSDVAVPARSFSTALLEMALARSGVHPVDISVKSSRVSQRQVVSLLDEHMHHMRSLRWIGSVESPCFKKPAPMLVHLECTDSHHGDIPEDFLGGDAGVLRILTVEATTFPPRCLALSTVTSLNVSIPLGAAANANIIALFDLCPRLEHLSLRPITTSMFHSLPTRPAPQTLVSVFLATADRGCDLMALLKSWDPAERIASAQLDMPIAACSGLARVLRGATDLVIEFIYKLSLCTEGFSLALRTGAETHPVSTMGLLLARCTGHMDILASARLPLAVLNALVRAIAPLSPPLLPALRNLDVQLVHDGDTTTIDELRYLSSLRHICPSLESLRVVLSFSPRFTGYPGPATRQAVVLLLEEHLRGILPGVKIRVEGPAYPEHV